MNNRAFYAWRYLVELTGLVPHRGSASPYEREAANWLGAQLQVLGYDVEQQQFFAPRDTLYSGPPVVFFGVVVAASVGLVWPWVGAIGAILFMLPMIGDMLGRYPDFDLLLPIFATQNVVARPKEASQPRVVVMAHYDTQKGSILFHPRFAPWITPLFSLAYLALALVPIALALKAFLPTAAWPDYPLLGASAVLLLVAGFLTIARWTGHYINGANDNGSGTAMALALARRLAESQDPRRGQVTFVFTGSEEVGERGAKHYFKTSGGSLSKAETLVINLDNIGGGQLHYLLGEGMLAYKAYDSRLLDLAGHRAGQEPEGFLTPKKNLLLPTDGLIASAAGFRAITFLATDENDNIPNYHWHTDTIETADRSLMDQEEEVLWRFLMDVLNELETATV